ncbi:coiled-coil domain-containing protein [Ferruginibacter albus]|uniref:coiled-coil domain-containing protein n=1 Tax=Ferruginibacter albus TaxID=2875540 RepID=UPI001CC491D9|nr:hypothetical protein [Ferruginibacter albus]UAY53244.1 hypothetical protein K9M53_06125 [Ferruginibacter albus]
MGIPSKISRRKFVADTTLSAFALSPLVTFLAGCIGVDEGFLFNGFKDDDFHFFDNNLTNLHFYFINAKINKKQLVLKTGLECYMIVKIPQQHISEELLSEKDFNDNYLNKNKNVTSKISGFSYLAFTLFPGTSINEKRRIELSDINTLLDWNNKKYYELIIPSASQYHKFNGDTNIPPDTIANGLTNFKKSGNPLEIDDNINNYKTEKEEDKIIAFYKHICQTLFNVGEENFPITLLEIPQGLFLTPYSGQDTGKQVKTVFSKPAVEIKRFVYNSSKGKVIRSVQEIWNTQMWFQQFENNKAFGDRYDPSLRPAGFTNSTEICTDDNNTPIPCPPAKGDCEKSNFNFLPTFIDKQELTYISNLGRENAYNEGPEWNIETKGLTFTGLGAIAKFHYKNYTPPAGTSLAEYEHHITLGRDEYIKVARIGVISCTGQRALHVKIGQRKIEQGISYMEFKEYVEIIEKEIVYFDPGLFIPGDPNPSEPYNYIQVRKSLKKPSTIVHSYDDIYDGNDNSIKENDVWDDREIWGLNELPENWNTHYKRWMFQKVVSTSTVSKPIKTDLPEACAYPLSDCAQAFWGVLEIEEDGIHKDCFMDFTGYDWNNKEIKFSSSFLFIRKDIIETGKSVFATEIFKKLFFDQPLIRRQINFINSEIAFTKDFIPAYQSNNNQEQLQNKSNVAKTDFVEYYFSLCLESSGETLEYDAANKKVKDSGKIVNVSSVFNERIFPLYPQVKRAQLYIDNIQSYSDQPLVSIIEYNEDFVKYGYQGFVRKPPPDCSIIVNENGKPSIYNKARLIFNHTEKFIRDAEDVLHFNGETKKWEQTTLTGAYTKIKQAFSGAGDKIGGLINPDFDIQCIGLVKQSISVGKKINEKYKNASDSLDKIERFNPGDLLRQAPEIFKGISLLDILKEVFPEYEAPVNDIKNVAGQIEGQLDSLPILKKIQDYNNKFQESINAAKQEIENLKAEIDDTVKKINDAENEIKLLKDQLNDQFQFSDIQNLINNKVEEYKNYFANGYNDIINQISIDVDKAIDFVITQVIKSIEKLLKAITDYDPIDPDLKDTALTNPRNRNQIYAFFTDQLLIDLGKGVDEDKKAINIVTSFVSFLFDGNGENADIKKYKDLVFDNKGNFKKYDDIKQEITKIIKEGNSSLIDIYNSYKEAAQQEIDSKAALILNKISIDQYNTVYDDLQKSLKIYNDVLDVKQKKRNAIKTLLSDLKNTQSKIIYQYERQISVQLAKLDNIYDLVLGSELFYWIDKYETLKKDYNALQSKVGSKKDKLGDAVLDITAIINNNNLNTLRDTVQKAWTDLQTKCANDYKLFLDAENSNGSSKGNFLKLINDKVALHQNEITEYLSSIFYPQIVQANEVFNKIKEKEKSIEDKVKGELVGFKKDLRDRQTEYENKLNKFIDTAAKNVIEQVQKFITYLNDQILNDPSKVELINDLAEAKDLYNKLAALTKKEVNFNWQTASIKNADFGIVAFLASDNPKTTFSVNVKNVIYFQPNKFPLVVSKVETLAENKLNNFGLSLFRSMIINFNEVSFSAGTNQKPKFEVKIRDVQFAGALSFVQAFESWLQSLMGDAFRLKIQPTNVNIGYTLPIPSIKTPGFNFFNLTLNFDFWLYFDNKPLQLGFSLARKDDKFGMAVGIYAGFGFFGLIAEPKRGITEIEIGFEFGGYFGLSLGPLRGEVKLVVGLYYKKDDTGITIEGYFLCEGRVQLWFVMINARFYMGIKSQNNYVEGRCTVSYEIKLGCFFKLSFQASYYKKIAGATPGNDASDGNQQNAQLVSHAAMLLPVDKRRGLVNMDSTDSLNRSQNTIKRTVIPLSKKEWLDYLQSYN